jgi:hypothetical protein
VDYVGGSAVLSTLSECMEIELSNFKPQDAMLKGDHLRQVVEIVIGGDPAVLEFRLIYCFMSLGRILLQGSVSINLVDQMKYQLNLRKAEVGI